MMTNEVAARASSIYVGALSFPVLVRTAAQLATSAACASLAAQQTSSLCVWPAAPAEVPWVY
jgi:hypothetical protein